MTYSTGSISLRLSTRACSLKNLAKTTKPAAPFMKKKAPLLPSLRTNSFTIVLAVAQAAMLWVLLWNLIVSIFYQPLRCWLKMLAWRFPARRPKIEQLVTKKIACIRCWSSLIAFSANNYARIKPLEQPSTTSRVGV